MTCSDPACPNATGTATWRDRLHLLAAVARDPSIPPEARAGASWAAGQILAARVTPASSVLRGLISGP